MQAQSLLSQGQSREDGRVSGLDTLRAVAIVVVMLCHLQGTTGFTLLRTVGRFGWCGVDLFFVLSGYLIGGQLFRSLKKTGTVSLASFYRRRAFRILPCFLVVLGAYLVWPQWKEREWTVPVWRFLTFTQNFGLHFSAFSQAWSLCIEEQFYWLFPLMVLFAGRFRKITIPAIAGVVILGLAYRWVIWSQVLHQGALGNDWVVPYYEWIYYPTFGRLDGLTVGVVLALLKIHRPLIWARFGELANAFSLLGLLAVAAALVGFEQNPYTLPSIVLGFPLLAIGFGLLVASAASGNGVLARVRAPGAGPLAILAYSLYLTHKQAFHLAGGLCQRVGVDSASGVGLGIFLVSALGAASALHWVVERPFLELRERVEERVRGVRRVCKLPTIAASDLVSRSTTPRLSGS